jgi:hypothetical protein
LAGLICLNTTRFYIISLNFYFALFNYAINYNYCGYVQLIAKKAIYIVKNNNIIPKSDLINQKNKRLRLVNVKKSYS